MGIPIETGIENLEEVLLKLSVTDRVKLIQWISESVVAEGEKDDALKMGSVTGSFVEAGNDDLLLTQEEQNLLAELKSHPWEDRVDAVIGLWKDHPMTAEELIEDIYTSRTISTREIKWDD